ncbi:hypothetical protein P7C73_g2116, partial [Tremellales sp. Uapishka_1]
MSSGMQLNEEDSPPDPLQLLAIINILETASTFSRLVKLVAKHAGDVAYFLDFNQRIEDFAGPFLTYLICTVCRIFFFYKALSFSLAMRHGLGEKMSVFMKTIVALICAGILASLAGTIAIPVVLKVGDGKAKRKAQADFSEQHYKSYLSVVGADGHFTGSYSTIIEFMIYLSLGLDLTLVCFMAIELHQARTGFGASDSVLDVLTTTAVRNGSLALSTQIGQLVVFRLNKKTAWFELPLTCISKIYAITIMSMLTAPRKANTSYHQRQQEAIGDLPTLNDIPNCHDVSLSQNQSSAVESMKFFGSPLPRTPQEFSLPTLRSSPLPLDVSVIRPIEPTLSNRQISFRTLLAGTEESFGGDSERPSQPVAIIVAPLPMVITTSDAPNLARDRVEGTSLSMDDQMLRVRGGGDPVSLEDVLAMTEVTYDILR